MSQNENNKSTDGINNDSLFRRLSIIIPVFYKIGVESYRSLNNDDKIIVNSLIFFDLALLFTIILVNSIIQPLSPDNSSFYNYLYIFLSISLSVSFGLSVAVTFSVLDRISILTPIERSIKQTVDESKSTLSLLSSNLESRLKSSDELLAETLKKMVDYHLYNNSRNKFGLSNVVNVDVIRDHSKDQYVAVPNKFLLDVINSAGGNEIVYYMNTYIENDYDYYDAFKNAAYHGADIRILLMTPDFTSHVVQSRIRDLVVAEAMIYGSEEKLFRSISNKHERLVTLSEQIELAKQSGEITGNLEVRFYKDSLNFPMVLINKNKNLSTIPYKAYTGFYAIFDSEKLPYLEWTEGDMSIIERTFFATFQHKWNNGIVAKNWTQKFD